jgi:hypothetical protein
MRFIREGRVVSMAAFKRKEWFRALRAGVTLVCRVPLHRKAGAVVALIRDLISRVRWA